MSGCRRGEREEDEEVAVVQKPKKREVLKYKGVAVEVPKIVNGVEVSRGFRKPTTEEFVESKRRFNKIEELRDLIDKSEEKLRELERDCKHVVFYDESGYIYDTRVCAACGHLMGMI